MLSGEKKMLHRAQTSIACLSAFSADVDLTRCRNPVPPNEMQRWTRLMSFLQLVSTSLQMHLQIHTCVDIRSKPYGTEQLPLLFCVQLLKELCSPRRQRITDDQSTLSNKTGNWRLPRIRHDPEIKMWSEKMRTELFLLSET